MRRGRAPRYTARMTSEMKTEHPHIVRVPGVCGGDPVIKGTRISVAFIARFIHGGTQPDEIVEMYPHLTHASVHDAISYYYDHKAEIDDLIANSTPEALADRYGYEVRDGRVQFDEH